MKVLFLTIILFAIAMAGLGIGVMFNRRAIRGHCGGGGFLGPDGKPIRCESCPSSEGDRLSGVSCAQGE